MSRIHMLIVPLTVTKKDEKEIRKEKRCSRYLMERLYLYRRFRLLDAFCYNWIGI